MITLSIAAEVARKRSARLAAAGILGALTVGGCGDNAAPPPVNDGAGIATTVFVSDPVATSAVTTMAVVVGSPVAYVSLSPGTVPGGMTATITNRRTAGTVTTALVDGGLDPVALIAEAGDSLDFVVDTGGTAPVRFARAVPRDVPVRTVRTEPSRGKRDVPLNVRTRVVFSEPVDMATVTGATVGLDQAGAPVGGTVALSADGLVASFQPAAELQPATTYTFTASTGVRDLDGNALVEPVAVNFTTVAQSANPPLGGPLPARPRLAFVRQAQPGADDRPGSPLIFVANSDGSGAALLTGGEHPAMSSDGRKVAFNRNDNELWMINTDGTGTQRLSTNAGPAAWSPDGSKIAFAKYDGSGGLMVINLPNPNATLLLAADFADSSGSGRLGLPAWSPDGRRISFIRYGDWFATPNQIYIVNADGSGPAPLVVNWPSCQGCDTMIHQPLREHSWSPDGSRIAAAVPVVNYITGSSYYALATFEPSGANPSIHHEDPAAFYLGIPGWLPDGRSLTFEKYVATAGCEIPQCPLRIFITNLDDGSVRQFIPEVPGAAPYWDSQISWSRLP